MTELDIKQIMKLIPQRYPFLLIDRIVEIDPWERLVAIKNISVNEPYSQGHFPGIPIMPGVLIIEAIAQAISVLYKYENRITTLKEYEIILGAVKSRFLNPAYPGDQMLIEATAVKFISTGGIAKGVSRAGDKILCNAEISFSVVDTSQLLGNNIWKE